MPTGAAAPGPERDGGAGQLLAGLYSDERITATLTKQGRRTAHDLPCTKARVRALHQRLGIAACRATEHDSYAPLLSLAATDRATISRPDSPITGPLACIAGRCGHGAGSDWPHSRILPANCRKPEARRNRLH